MSNYVWRVTDRNGEEMIREITAETSSEAREILLGYGFTNLKLMQDDIGRHGGWKDAKGGISLGEEINPTAEDRYKNRNKQRASSLSIWTGSTLAEQRNYRPGVARRRLWFL